MTITMTMTMTSPQIKRRKIQEHAEVLSPACFVVYAYVYNSFVFPAADVYTRRQSLFYF